MLPRFPAKPALRPALYVMIILLLAFHVVRLLWQEPSSASIQSEVSDDWRPHLTGSSPGARGLISIWQRNHGLMSVPDSSSIDAAALTTCTSATEMEGILHSLGVLVHCSPVADLTVDVIGGGGLSFPILQWNEETSSIALLLGWEAGRHRLLSLNTLGETEFLPWQALLTSRGSLFSLNSITNASGIWMPFEYFDAGTINPTVEYSVVRYLCNAGTLPVEIVRHETTCGCVAVKAFPRSIPPGEVRPIELTVYPKKSTSPRHIQQRVLLWTHEESKPYVFPVVATIEARVVLDPEIVYIGDVPPDAITHSVDSSLKCADSSSTMIEPTFVTSGATVEILKVPDSTSIPLRLTVDFRHIRENADGDFVAGAKLRVRHPNEDGLIFEEELALRVAGLRRRWIEFLPSRLDFGVARTGQTYERRVRVRAFCQSTDIRVVVSDPEWLSARMDGDLLTARFKAPRTEPVDQVFHGNVLVQVGQHSGNLHVSAFVPSTFDDSNRQLGSPEDIFDISETLSKVILEYAGDSALSESLRSQSSALWDAFPELRHVDAASAAELVDFWRREIEDVRSESDSGKLRAATLVWQTYHHLMATQSPLPNEQAERKAEQVLRLEELLELAVTVASQELPMSDKTLESVHGELDRTIDRLREYTEAPQYPFLYYPLSDEAFDLAVTDIEVPFRAAIEKLSDEYSSQKVEVLERTRRRPGGLSADEQMERWVERRTRAFVALTMGNVIRQYGIVHRDLDYRDPEMFPLMQVRGLGVVYRMNEGLDAELHVEWTVESPPDPSEPN